MSNNKESSSSSSRLFHPILEQVPLPIRFAISGVTGNAIFLVVYNTALAVFVEYSASTIFAVVQFGCIILNHFLNVGIVFGWPSNYLASLMSNMPVGLSSLALGAWLAGYLQRINIDFQVKTALGLLEAEAVAEEAGGFIASILVMGVTGIYNYVVLNLVNKPQEEKQKVN